MTDCSCCDQGWRNEAVCRGLDADLFFPDHGDTEAFRAAVKVCQGCPVREPCLHYALRHEGLGVWGGTSERGRRRMRRAQGIALASPQSGWWEETA